ncbi:PHP domain-containing protein [Paenibacillus xylanexedens]|uniref:PHP domain-containing protein n=1 Tax=Paenibacillus xylanexedens TaxID=528191 RepID=UPI003CC8268A
MHQHTNCSDGLLSIEETIHRCINNHVKTISITDHDSFQSQNDAILICKKNNIKYIYGVELSAVYENQSVHVLGYFPNYPSSSLERYVANQRIITTVKANRSKSKSVPVGYYPIEEITRLIHASNGYAILAHPVIYSPIINELVSMVDGIECINPSQDLEFTEEMIQLCREFNLLCTFGTDFHGIEHENIHNYNSLCEQYSHVIEPFLSKIHSRTL